MDRFSFLNIDICEDYRNHDLIMVKCSNFITHFIEAFDYTQIPEIMDWIVEYSIWSYVDWEYVGMTINEHTGREIGQYRLFLVIPDPAQAIFFKTRWYPFSQSSGATP